MSKIINQEDLELWADAAAQLIQEYIDDAENSSQSSDSAEIEKPLLKDYECIKKGQSPIQH